MERWWHKNVSIAPNVTTAVKWTVFKPIFRSYFYSKAQMEVTLNVNLTSFSRYKITQPFGFLRSPRLSKNFLTIFWQVILMYLWWVFISFKMYTFHFSFKIHLLKIRYFREKYWSRLTPTWSAWPLRGHWALKSILWETLFLDQLGDFSLFSLNSFLQLFLKSKFM